MKPTAASRVPERGPGKRGRLALTGPSAPVSPAAFGYFSPVKSTPPEASSPQASYRSPRPRKVRFVSERPERPFLAPLPCSSFPHRAMSPAGTPVLRQSSFIPLRLLSPRRRKHHIPRFRRKSKARSFCCGSSPHERRPAFRGDLGFASLGFGGAPLSAPSEGKK